MPYNLRLRNLLTDWSGLGESAQLPDEVFEQLKKVWEASDFAAQTCLRHPQWLLQLQQQGALENRYVPGQMAKRLQQALQDCADETELSRRLRRFRNQQMLRIIWRDIAALAPLPETLEDLSELADVCIRQSLQWLMDAARKSLGTPRDSQGRAQCLVVLGMGKLGARELNLSSDIDLIFSFPAHGQTDGRRALSNEQFFTRVGRQLISVLGKVTADGFVFRVDMRLRPFGEAGALALSFSAMETYYETQAREWERYAMIKARPITGESVYQEQLLSMLRPFVYRRYIDFGVIAAIRDMKQRIQAEMHKRGMDDNIKLGQGGIREIEFIGQALQLVYGGRDRDLQVRPILQVLTVLQRKGLLPAPAARALEDAYCFLRLAENRIQAWKDEQTHLLPADEPGRQRLATSMGFPDWAAFSAALQQHRQQVGMQFASVFRNDAENEPEDPWTELWRNPGDAQQVMQLLHLAEPGQARELSALLRSFSTSGACQTLPAAARDKLDRLMPRVLQQLAAYTQPTVLLQRLLQVIRAILKRSAYLDLLLENAQALEHLVKLADGSIWVVNQLLRYPVLLDELLDPRRLYRPLRKDELATELDALLGRIAERDLEQQMERLRQFAAGNRLRVAAADITGAIPLMVVSDYLSEIAEVVLDKVLQLAWNHLVARHGLPGEVSGSGFAVIGYGKLGGWELGYGSDLDLVFLRQNTAIQAMTQGAKAVPNEVFYMRLGQRMIHLLNTRTASGVLYEVDMRLRPNGNSGLLVSSLAAFENYQQEHAWTWEQQALVRARAVAGDAALAAEFARLRKNVLCLKRDPQILREAVAAMREKMRDRLDRSNATEFDLKQGKGGITDIEFMVQYLVLRWAAAEPVLTAWTDNVRLLQVLADQAILPQEQAGKLSQAYQHYRDVYHHLSLQDQPGRVRQTELQLERKLVQQAWRQIILQQPSTGEEYADDV